MSDTRFIAVDWGSTNMRIYLCEHHPGAPTEIIRVRRGPGVVGLKHGFEQILFSRIADWLAVNPSMPVLMAGMIGSDLGWHEVSYTHCPADDTAITQAHLRFEARGTEVALLSGLSCTNPLGLPDSLRGEELQILGWIRRHRTDSQLLILPGTHNKWVHVQDGSVVNFMTGLTGELYGLLANRSVLLSSEGGYDEQAFDAGVAAVLAAGAEQLVHLLFSTRSLRVREDKSSDWASSYLSGLLIGSDVAGAVSAWQTQLNAGTAVTLISEATLSERYVRALSANGIDVQLTDSTQTAIEGFTSLYEQLLQRAAA